jgi:hypothetical protein
MPGIDITTSSPAHRSREIAAKTQELGRQVVEGRAATAWWSPRSTACRTSEVTIDRPALGAATTAARGPRRRRHKGAGDQPRADDGRVEKVSGGVKIPGLTSRQAAGPSPQGAEGFPMTPPIQRLVVGRPAAGLGEKTARGWPLHLRRQGIGATSQAVPVWRRSSSARSAARAEHAPAPLCRPPARRQVLCVVAGVSGQLAIERTREFPAAPRAARVLSRWRASARPAARHGAARPVG